MRKFNLLIINILLIILLTACGKPRLKAKVVTEELIISRQTVDFVFKLEDPKDEINENTLEGKLFHKDKEINTYKPKLENKDEKIYKISITNLSINHEYTLKLNGIAHKRSYVLYDHTFRTKHEGSSKDNPIYIETVEQFLDMENDHTAYYKLVNDLDFTDYEYKAPFQTRSFLGNFDGNGKTLKNILIKDRATYVGVWGRNGNDGIIKNLTLENVNIMLLGTSQSSQYIGLLTARNAGTIENVNVIDSSISTGFSHSGTVRVGGVAGYSESNSMMKDTTANIAIDLKGVSRTEFYVGGLTGELNGSNIENSNVTTKLTMTNTTTTYIGGAVGLMSESSINHSTIKETEAKLDLDLTTVVTRVISNDKTVAISIGGFVGKAVKAKINDAYASAKVAITKIFNTVKDQSIHDKLAIGGFAGSVSNRSEFTNVLARIDLDVGEEFEHEDSENVEVKFDLGHSDDRLAKQEIEVGSKVGEPKEPTRKGYEFVGWYYGLTKYNFDNEVTEDIVLTAQWKAKEITITFDSDGGSLVDSITQDCGTSVKKPKDPEKVGQQFAGWFTRTVDSEGEVVEERFVFSYMPTENTTVYAKWVSQDEELEKDNDEVKDLKGKDLLQVIFDLSYGNNYETTVKVESGQKAKAPKVTPRREGYIFQGWYLAGELYDFDTDVELNITLVAKWEKASIGGFDIVYIGGIVGETHASTHDKNFSINGSLNIHTSNGIKIVNNEQVVEARYMISQTMGNQNTVGDYYNANLTIDNVVYENEAYAKIDSEVETFEMFDTQLDGYFDSEFLNEIINRE